MVVAMLNLDFMLQSCKKPDLKQYIFYTKKSFYVSRFYFYFLSDSRQINFKTYFVYEYLLSFELKVSMHKNMCSIYINGE